VWMGALPSWKTASLFGNNIWIMRCTWLTNLSTYVYTLAVIRPWRVIIGQRENHDIAALSQNLPYVSLLEPAILDL
jgi:hypothetical protein